MGIDAQMIFLCDEFVDMKRAVAAVVFRTAVAMGVLAVAIAVPSVEAYASVGIVVVKLEHRRACDHHREDHNTQIIKDTLHICCKFHANLGIKNQKIYPLAHKKSR